LEGGHGCLPRWGKLWVGVGEYAKPSRWYWGFRPGPKAGAKRGW
jgi:hypothetical protein